jgi:hypothetical protein
LAETCSSQLKSATLPLNNNFITCIIESAGIREPSRKSFQPCPNAKKMQWQVTYVKISKQGINHTFESLHNSTISISLNYDKYDQILITNHQTHYEDIKVFPGSVTTWQKSGTELWFKYMTLTKLYKRFQVHFASVQDLEACLIALEKMGIVVKHSDTRHTLKAGSQAADMGFATNIAPSVNTTANSTRKIKDKRRVKGKAEYLITMGNTNEWVAYSNEWPISDQQLALEYEKVSSSQMIESFTNLKDSSDTQSFNKTQEFVGTIY